MNVEKLKEQFLDTRSLTIKICEPLETEDYVVQPASEVSPPKWHLGHTSWFFDRMLLRPYLKSYQSSFESFDLKFNSYYKACGQHWIQGERGQLARPTVRSILDFRRFVDEKIVELLDHLLQDFSDDERNKISHIVEIGIHHEQQHQELLLMDIKYIHGVDPCPPRFSATKLPETGPIRHSDSIFENGGVVEIGASSKVFSYDNEAPRHKCYLYPFSISKTLVTNGEFAEFIEDGGYENPKLWLSKGWDWVNQNKITKPMYWITESKDSKIPTKEYSLHGLIDINQHAPVSHISYFEANAFANWSNARLPTEQEFEYFLQSQNAEETHDLHTAFASGLFHPTNAEVPAGQLWCWTQSHYSPYPGFREFEEGLGEYNGKFMCNQFVLKGGCFATPPKHYRDTYRNFYEPHQRWMFSGIRLAKNLL